MSPLIPLKDLSRFKPMTRRVNQWDFGDGKGVILASLDR